MRIRELLGRHPKTILASAAAGALALGAAPVAAGDAGVFAEGSVETHAREDGERGIFDNDDEGGLLDFIGLDNDDLEADLDPLNRSGTRGSASIEIHDHDTVTVRLATRSASANLPHAQHVHIGGENVCPTIHDDDNGDGLIDTLEGAPAYGGVKVSLTVEGAVGQESALAVNRMPVADSHGDVVYSRTFDLPDDVTTDELEDGVIVQHGVSGLFGDPAAYDGSPRSSLNAELPLEATIPAACGELNTDNSLLGLGILDFGDDHEDGDDRLLDLGDDDEGHDSQDVSAAAAADTGDDESQFGVSITTQNEADAATSVGATVSTQDDPDESQAAVNVATRDDDGDDSAVGVGVASDEQSGTTVQVQVDAEADSDAEADAEGEGLLNLDLFDDGSDHSQDSDDEGLLESILG